MLYLSIDDEREIIHEYERYCASRVPWWVYAGAMILWCAAVYCVAVS